MAFVEVTSSGGVPFFCNVSAGVGQGQPNRRDDVMLVQWLLHQYFSNAPKVPPPPGPMIKIDGLFGRQTGAYIQQFQTGGKANGYNIKPDGVISRASGFIGGAGSQYTITHLNNAAHGQRPNLDRKFWAAPDFPSEVQRALVASSQRA